MMAGEMPLRTSMSFTSWARASAMRLLMASLPVLSVYPTISMAEAVRARARISAFLDVGWFSLVLPS